MKVRCPSCRTVSKVRDYAGAACQSCGQGLTMPMLGPGGGAMDQPASAAAGTLGSLPVKRWGPQLGRLAIVVAVLIGAPVVSVLVGEMLGTPIIAIIGVFGGIILTIVLAILLEKRASDHPVCDEAPPPGATAIPINFRSSSSVDLAANERVSIWETMREGEIAIGASVVQLRGKWALPLMGYVFNQGALGHFIVNPMILRDRVETLFPNAMHCLIVHRKKATVTFHLLQERDGGLLEMHIFRAKKKEDADALTQWLQRAVPPEKVVAAGDRPM